MYKDVMNKVDPIGSVRWDKIQLPKWDDNTAMRYSDARESINFESADEFVNRFMDDRKFWESIQLNDNIIIYAKYKIKRNYDPYLVVRALMRIANVYRKKVQDDSITTLNEIIYIAHKLETRIYYEYIIPAALQLEDEGY